MNKELFKLIKYNIPPNIDNVKITYLYSILSNPLIIDKSINLQPTNAKMFSSHNIFNFLYLYMNYLHSDYDIKIIEKLNFIDFTVYDYILNYRKHFLKKLKPFVSVIYKPALNLNKINVYKNGGYIFVRNKFNMFYNKDILKIINKIQLNEFYLELRKDNKYCITNFYHKTIKTNIFLIQYKKLFCHK